MNQPGSSGKAGPTPISTIVQGTHDGEQVRPSFHFGGWYLSLGDEITGYHRIRKMDISGTLIILFGCLAISTVEGVFPIQRVAIHSVAPPAL